MPFLAKLHAQTPVTRKIFDNKSPDFATFKTRHQSLFNNHTDVKQAYGLETEIPDIERLKANEIAVKQKLLRQSPFNFLNRDFITEGIG